MTTHTTTFERDLGDGEYVEATVEFTLSGGCEAQTYGPPEHCYPAEAPDFEVETVTLETGEVTTLTDAEFARVRAEVFDRLPDFDDGMEEF